MTSNVGACNEETFKRGICNEAFIEALKQLAAGESWWREVLADPNLIIAIRDEYLNVYWQGQSLFHVTYESGTVLAKTHPKYLLDPELEKLVPFDGEQFTLAAAASPLAQTWEAGVTLGKMKRAAGLYAGREKKGVHELVRWNPAVLDVEITLRRPDAQDDERDLPRIDIAALERDRDAVRLVFWEAKLFSNKELRARGSGRPRVLKQIEDYRKILAQKHCAVLASYRRVARNLADIAAMRPGITVLNDLTKRVAEKPLLLTMAEPPDVGLVIFGYDDDQKKGAIWEYHKAKLREALSNRLRTRGKARNVQLGTKP